MYEIFRTFIFIISFLLLDFAFALFVGAFIATGERRDK